MEKLAKVYYLLNEEGRKDSLLKGGNGKMLQEIDVPITDKLLKFATVDANGDVTVKFGFQGDPENILAFPDSAEIIVRYVLVECCGQIGNRSVSYRNLREKTAIIMFSKVQTADSLVEQECYRRRFLESQYKQLKKISDEELESITESIETIRSSGRILH